MPVWANVRLHLTADIKEFIDANAEWLTVFKPPAYAPDLHPQEGIWSLVRGDIPATSPPPTSTRSPGR